MSRLEGAFLDALNAFFGTLAAVWSDLWSILTGTAAVNGGGTGHQGDQGEDLVCDSSVALATDRSRDWPVGMEKPEYLEI